MNVNLINHTGDALNLLLKTKSTRLKSSDPSEWGEAKKLEHLEYMRDTIKSSWEFVDYTFEIKDVTRAFTHQLVRTRSGSYAQESQRSVDVSDNGFHIPEVFYEEGRDNASYEYQFTMKNAYASYETLLRLGIPTQDARGVLPTNGLTSIIAKFNLRTLHEMALVRLCVRTQGEYQRVFKAMKDEVVRVHEWAEPFIRVACAQTGICIFPRYKECPIQPLTYNGANPAAHKSGMEYIQQVWSQMDHEAVPVVKDGRTM